MAKQPEKYWYWVFLVYPSSAPDDWMERLRATHGMFAISPLHAPDDENNAEHYHVIYKHENSIRFEYASRILNATGVPANGYVEPCSRPCGYQRYLLHLDDGEKQQFVGNPNDLIKCLNGFPLDLTREYTPAQRREQRTLCFKLIRDNGLTEYADFLDGLIDAGKYDLFDYACSHSILFSHYFSSVRGRMCAIVSSGPDNVSYEK